MKFRHALFLLSLTVFLSNCTKCIYKPLPRKKCERGFDIFPATIYKQVSLARTGGRFPPHGNELFIINDDSTFAKFYPESWDIKEIGSVDFRVSTIIGVNIDAGWGKHLESQGYLCYKPKSLNYEFNVQHTLHNRCDGSDIDEVYFSGILICPKLPSNVSISLDVTLMSR